jgi:hypothetical protein
MLSCREFDRLKRRKRVFHFASGHVDSSAFVEIRQNLRTGRTLPLDMSPTEARVGFFNSEKEQPSIAECMTGLHLLRLQPVFLPSHLSEGFYAETTGVGAIVTTMETVSSLIYRVEKRLSVIHVPLVLQFIERLEENDIDVSDRMVWAEALIAALGINVPLAVAA